MPVLYNRLWKLLIDRNLNKTKLRDMANISNQTLSKLSKNQYVSLEVLERVCKCLECNIEDVVEYVEKDKGK
ncbi:helix-turn-helix domain-containing protein [Peptostreptococcus sp.]|uniref:helix-turn-helix domain-containing protein n=1 Tax=Peptostreptococcus sp. TaxID=1262 RepID=UPI003992024E